MDLPTTPCRRLRRPSRNALGWLWTTRPCSSGLSPWQEALSAALAVKDVRLPKPV